MRAMNISYNEIMEMPVHERRFFINIFTEQREKEEEKLEELRNNSNMSSSKGTRTKRISGNAVKNFSGKI